MAQLGDTFCRQIRSRLNEGEGLPFAVNNRGLLVRNMGSNSRIVIPATLQPRVLYLSHYSQLDGHPGGRPLNTSLHRYFYWPATDVDCYATAKNRADLARERVKLRRSSTAFMLYPAK